MHMLYMYHPQEYAGHAMIQQTVFAVSVYSQL